MNKEYRYFKILLSTSKGDTVYMVRSDSVDLFYNRVIETLFTDCRITIKGSYYTSKTNISYFIQHGKD